MDALITQPEQLQELADKYGFSEHDLFLYLKNPTQADLLFRLAGYGALAPILEANDMQFNDIRGLIFWLIDEEANLIRNAHAIESLNEEFTARGIKLDELRLLQSDLANFAADLTNPPKGKAGLAILDAPKPMNWELSPTALPDIVGQIIG